MSRVHTGEGSASIKVRSDSISLASFSWRALSSASSRLSPLASRSRSTARPPMARPSASMTRPASVISCMEKLSPSARSASTACSMACALSGSSHDPNASTRCGTDPLVTSVVSPRMSGSLSAAAHDTRICGSDISSALKRSRSALSAMISSRKTASAEAARNRVRTSVMAETTANSSTPSIKTSATMSLRLSSEKASM
jgi:hypothetical protein